MQDGQAYGELVAHRVGGARLQQRDLERLAEVIREHAPGELELVGQQVEKRDVREAGLGVGRGRAENPAALPAAIRDEGPPESGLADTGRAVQQHASTGLELLGSSLNQSSTADQFVVSHLAPRRPIPVEVALVDYHRKRPFDTTSVTGGNSMVTILSPTLAQIRAVATARSCRGTGWSAVVDKVQPPAAILRGRRLNAGLDR